MKSCIGGNDAARELIVCDYHASLEPQSKTIDATLDLLFSFGDRTTRTHRAGESLRNPTTAEAQDSALSPCVYHVVATYSQVCSSPTSIS